MVPNRSLNPPTGSGENILYNKEHHEHNKDHNVGSPDYR